MYTEHHTLSRMFQCFPHYYARVSEIHLFSFFLQSSAASLQEAGEGPPGIAVELIIEMHA